MKILIIEDDELKHRHLHNFVNTLFPSVTLIWKRSYQSGLFEVLNFHYDLVLLDMSMHIYEKDAGESGGSFETYAGRMILSEIDLNEVDSKVIVVTGYDVFGDGKTLNVLKEELSLEFGSSYLDTVYFIGSEDKWKSEIRTIVENNFPEKKL